MNYQWFVAISGLFDWLLLSIALFVISGMLGDFLKWSGQNNIKPAYEAIPANVLPAWGAILLMIVIFTAIAVIALKFIDKDKR